jgi:hypothetical protein
MTKNFYLDLPSFQQFEEFTHEENYQSLPDDWFVIVADIKNSTQAINDGYYKEVNLIGAASITQTMQTQDIPFVFGGDGATMYVPRDAVEPVALQLSKLKKLSQENFGLELRVAVIPMQDIHAHGVDVQVAKLEITENKYIALFRGGGLAIADMLAKDDKDKKGSYEIDVTSENLDSLTGLSCRWSPVPAKKGKVVSLMVMARDAKAMDVYQSLVESFREILGREISETNPVQDNLNTYKGVSEAFRDEAKYHASWFSLSFLSRFLDILLSVSVYRYGISLAANFFNARGYKDTISSHSDFRKFDDTLRLIMDCTEDEVDRLSKLLEQGYLEGHLYYGLHASEEALMTCFVESTTQGGHLHFIDGGDGGLAMASIQMKKQKEEQKEEQ